MVRKKRRTLLARAGDGVPREPGDAEAAPHRAGRDRVTGARGVGAVLAVRLRLAGRLPRRRPLQLQAEPAAPRRRRLRGVEPHEAGVGAAELGRGTDPVRRRRPARHERAAERQRRAGRRRGVGVGVAERAGRAVERGAQQRGRAVEEHDGVGGAHVEGQRRVQLHAAAGGGPHGHARVVGHQRRRGDHQALLRRRDGGDRVRGAVERVEEERRRAGRAPDLVRRVAAPGRRAQRVRHRRRAARGADPRMAAHRQQRRRREDGDGCNLGEEHETAAKRSRHCFKFLCRRRLGG
uniref:Predicted protein n=1 Tax=Hordeum vulgare subsp. vulgare TaxID=112509 RepID=F2DHY0_HORVV|nr:predicted protein [Hordeum vulgare subsp. vulgare]